MNDRKKDFCSSPEFDQPDRSRFVRNKSKINRLKRSPRTSQPQLRPQKQSDTTDKSDLKTPTRLPTGRFRRWTTVESPNSDAEFQQDIVWDPTSPATPFRNGRSRRKTPNIKSVDILDIVSRIAPKSRRPEEELSLLQWIGDSAVPCTPEGREHTAQPKSTRQNVADDLLKLAKQFDFSMMQNEGPVLQPRQQNLEDQELFIEENNPPARPQAGDPKVKTALALLEEDDVALVQEMEDDLDLLFDGSTIQASSGGFLSQGLSGNFQEKTKNTPDAPVGANLTTRPCEDTVAKLPVPTVTVCGNGCSGRVTGVGGNKEVDVANLPVSAFLSGKSKPGVSKADNFENDWGSDDLLEDSLVFEMTQNPELFFVPPHSSTQEQIDRNEGDNFFKNTNGNAAKGTCQQQAGNDKNFNSVYQPNHRPKSRQTFQMDPQPAQQWNWLPSNGMPAENNQQRRVVSSSKIPSVVSGTRIWNQCQLTVSRLDDQPQVEHTSGTTNIHRVGPSKSVPSAPSKSWCDEGGKIQEEKSHPIAECLADIIDDDLDSIFASDDIWDDEADDDNLLCEVCEKVEESSSKPDPDPEAPVAKARMENTHVQGRAIVIAMATGHNAMTNATYPKGEGLFVQPYTPNAPTLNVNPYKTHEALSMETSLSPHPAPPAGAGAFTYRNTLLGNTVDSSLVTPSSGSSKGPYRFTHVKKTSGMSSTVGNAALQQQVCERGVATSHQSSQRDPDGHHFKKPYSTFNNTPVSRDVNQMTVVTMGRCSDAEIERKKQQAMERRRLRMLANQNLQAPV